MVLLLLHGRATYYKSEAEMFMGNSGYGNISRKECYRFDAILRKVNPKLQEQV